MHHTISISRQISTTVDSQLPTVPVMLSRFLHLFRPLSASSIATRDGTNVIMDANSSTHFVVHWRAGSREKTKDNRHPSAFIAVN